MSTTIAPPELLADAELVALVLPFGEAVDPEHEDAGRVFEWGAVRLPRQPVPLRERHDGPQIGLLSGFVSDRATGIWARVKLGRIGSSLIGSGRTAISAEIDDDALVGAALVPVDERPAFASARLHGREVEPPEGFVLRMGLDPATGLVKFFQPRPAPPSRASHPAMNLTEHRRIVDGFGMAAVEAAVERDRERFRARQEELAAEPLELEEQALIAAAVPMPQWPAHVPRRKQWDDLERHQARDRAARRVGAMGRLLTLQAAAAAAQRHQAAAPAVPSPRRSWWRRMLGIGRRSAMDDVWGPVPEGTEIPERDEFEIVVTPEEPDEIVTTAEENLERQLEEAREVARGDILAWAVGTWTPRSEVRMWHPVFREAYETEFERLKAERLRVTGAAP